MSKAFELTVPQQIALLAAAATIGYSIGRHHGSSNTRDRATLMQETSKPSKKRTSKVVKTKRKVPQALAVTKLIRSSFSPSAERAVGVFAPRWPGWLWSSLTPRSMVARRQCPKTAVQARAVVEFGSRPEPEAARDLDEDKRCANTMMPSLCGDHLENSICSTPLVYAPDDFAGESEEIHPPPPKIMVTPPAESPQTRNNSAREKHQEALELSYDDLGDEDLFSDHPATPDLSDDSSDSSNEDADQGRNVDDLNENEGNAQAGSDIMEAPKYSTYILTPPRPYCIDDLDRDEETVPVSQSITKAPQYSTYTLTPPLPCHIDDLGRDEETVHASPNIIGPPEYSTHTFTPPRPYRMCACGLHASYCLAIHHRLEHPRVVQLRYDDE